MDHALVTGVEKALGWEGPGGLGHFARGTLPDPALAGRLLTPDRLLDLLMRRSLEPPQVRCFGDGQELHPNAYTTADVTSRGQSVRLVHMHRLAGLLRRGTTVILDRANLFDPTLEVACRAVQWWSGERVSANLYLTTHGADGFGMHWDDHDVLAVQLSGEKDWEVRGPSRQAPLFRDAARNDQVSEDVVWAGTLRAGDVLHIPRGYWHQAGRGGLGAGHSLHMTLGFTTRTGAGWLSWLADWSRENELFRRDLLRRATPEQERAQHRELAAAAGRLIDSRSPAAFLAAREQDAAPPRHVPFLGLSGPLESVVCVSEFPPRIVERGQTVEVLGAGKRLTFTARALPALRLLLSGRPVPLEPAAGLVGAEVRTLAEILVEEELCAPLTPELSSGYTGLVTNAAC
ncbi:cupin domain-containing protein [Streptomyces sp. DSM 44917]|uniref:Cupin domain-containing protein n=1 Tax=Streptomyces boetiae TaxID=3075541 RepID=A0ABU2LA67_9ACTN|nr:cupin domain-containing protein [Streptomyces sp. DSM 44917]MDT0308459.1 cupin domain-containing protein [Streptomyces sp. DSM 44917]